ncbi:tRNA (adenine(58)-N(1))-methyltransferase non-catalytic subunit trm6 [Leucoagaricus gongylophorus]
MPPEAKQHKDVPTYQPDLRDAVIQSGDYVLVQLSSGGISSVKVDSNTTATIKKFGTFYANDLIGQKYGNAYEIQGKNLKALPPQTLQEALKEAGAHATDIIRKQIEQHSNYSLKTEYSKEKYKKRKAVKYLRTFTTIPPILSNVCDYWFAKDQERIRDIRIDTLSQLLSLANVRPGGRYIVVDDASGIVVSALLERMGGT